ncbi:AraC family transcriptional regulator [Flavobacterium crocinum]|uniref:AraC family transcriptional regulator n=1 Tax=Flavobacterium crocinum TaxID=2183896 RepID=A0A2S1YL20_9FLAO|nr:AraC family transcriptional regulator [Flavobacterium crocinum]AWK04764.1 AraC family transcriptional regulator [Flavobacterium crocinum]
MSKEQLYKPFEIVYKTLDECPKLEHQHTFFELIYILDGKGIQVINDNQFRYHPNHMFLITPSDIHRFDIEEKTTFFFLRFTDIYIKNGGLSAKNIEQLEFILQNANHQPGCILKNQIDKSLVRPIVEGIIREEQNQDVYNTDLITHLVNTLIVIVARNIAKYLPENVNEYSEERILQILQFIQSNIFNPEELRAEKIGAHFGLSTRYLGKYFKKHTEVTLQEYIARYKTQLIVHRLKHSDLRINEIASLLGFTDESHLNKFFKKNKGTSPVGFRKALRAGLVK